MQRSRVTTIIAAATTAGILVLTGACGGKDTGPASTNVALEPINSATNPFMPPVGVDQANVAPPANAGGSFAGSTAGLYGGTMSQSSCDPGKMVAYLNAHADKAAAWASVLGIQPSDIGTFVTDLTPTVLRSDTYVINHGFVNGTANAVPAVLQAGTAVLVDTYGFPVTKCYCGNPLQRPTAYNRIVYTGPTWPSFSSTNITVIQSTTVVINQFTLVDPGNGKAFDRPRGTFGRKDGPATVQPPPLSSAPAPGPITASAVPTSPAGGPPAVAPPPPPSSVAPPPPSSAAPPPPPPPPPSSAVPPPPSSAAPPPPASSAAVPSATKPLAPPSTAPSALVPPPSAIPAPAPSTSAGQGARSSAPVTASWIVGNCYADATGTLHGTVVVRNNDPASQHSYQVTVAFGSHGDVNTSLAGVGPGQTETAEVLRPAGGVTPGSSVPCEITKIVDETGRQPARGADLPAPPDTRPSTTTRPPSTEPPSTRSVIPAPSAETETTTEPETTSTIPAPEPS